MKRMNVVLNEDLVEEIRRATGERTYSAAIATALEDFRRRHSFREALRQFEEAAKDGGVFYPGYEEEVRPRAYSIYYAKQKRVSADEKRAPKQKARRRGAR